MHDTATRTSRAAVIMVMKARQSARSLARRRRPAGVSSWSRRRRLCGRPGAADQSGLLEAAQRRVDRARGRIERAAGGLARALDDRVAVSRAGFETGQQQCVEVALEGFDADR